jgi:putative transposase
MARLEIPGVPLHIVQRGVNRVRVFEDDSDRFDYLRLLDLSRRMHGIAIHAYVLMTNHVHLLVSAGRAGAISAAMHRLGVCYVRRFNRRHDRVGTLWQGRFKSCLVDHERYLWAVYRYIELNPVRAGMVERPEEYRWSSVHGNTGRCTDSLLTPHPAFLELAPDDRTRASRHRDALRAAMAPELADAIRRHTAQERALGSEAFRAEVEQCLNRTAHLRPVGRPKKMGTGTVNSA